MPLKYNQSKPLTPNRLKNINTINVKYEQKIFLLLECRNIQCKTMACGIINFRLP